MRFSGLLFQLELSHGSEKVVNRISFGCVGQAIEDWKWRLDNILILWLLLFGRFLDWWRRGWPRSFDSAFLVDPNLLHLGGQKHQLIKTAL